ncbi:hypothetical protein [Nonomuraea phyllanthi]|uniref:hypothetical protein n=1 Tax=Nonomuraea phyllanthi TaxID=2219224 RepID=UPI00129327F6|nr:hypothetical protein [Nonomuraea phyllanthi]
MRGTGTELQRRAAEVGEWSRVRTTYPMPQALPMPVAEHVLGAREGVSWTAG